ncbi:MAG: DoxX family protein [Bacteroidales bacterium]|nr:DoxX family protein [Bacteroidales bacterium]
MPKKHIKENTFIAIFRILIGLVFIFSSFMKGVDPLGTAYRVEDYLEAYGMYWLLDGALAISFFLISVEFLLGIAIILKLKVRLAALGVLLIMFFFTVLTWFDARYTLVPDCGCFGDAIKLSNWETFYKNIVLVLMAVVVFFKRKTIASRLPQWTQSVSLMIFTGAFVYFVFYNYNHLPLLDFRDWKEGKDMRNTGEGRAKTFVTYRDKQTGEEKEYLSPDYPWNDSAWMARWEFVGQRVDESGVVRKHELYIEDDAGNELTKAVIEHPGDQFLLISYDLDFADGEGMLKAARIFHVLDEQGIAFDMLSASDTGLIRKYKEVYQMDYPVYFADDTELKAMIRSNPGLVWLRNGVVMKKWHYNDFPDRTELEALLSP